MKKRWSLLLVLVLILGLLCGCGSKSASDESMNTKPSEAFDDVTYDAAAGEMGWTNKSETAADFDMPELPAPTPMPDSAPMEPSAGQENQTGNGLPENVKIIYTADVNLESTRFDATVQGLNELVASAGGYFEYSNLENYNSHYRSGSYTVRVPAEKFQSFCDSMGDLCQVNSISRNAQDVSEAYYDTESRLVTQQTKLARLQELLSRAELMEDIITLESAISDTELAIEQLTGSLRKYDSLVGYATVHIYLQEVYQLTEQEQPVIGFGAKLAAAFRTGCSRFVYGLQDLLISLARAWVGWLIFLAVVVVVVLVVWRIIRRRKAHRAQVQQIETKDEREQ